MALETAVFEKGAELMLGSGDFSAGKFKAILADMDDAGPTPGAWKITGVTNSATPTVTTSGSHGLSVGDLIAISLVGGATGANGVWRVATAPTATTFTFAAGSSVGAYTSATGYVANLSLTFLSDFLPTAGRVATSAALTGKNVTKGVISCSPISWSGVAGDATESVVIVRAAVLDADTDLADTAQRLVWYFANLTGFPLPVNPGTVNWTPNPYISKYGRA